VTIFKLVQNGGHRARSTTVRYVYKLSLNGLFTILNDVKHMK